MVLLSLLQCFEDTFKYSRVKGQTCLVMKHDGKAADKKLYGENNILLNFFLLYCFVYLENEVSDDKSITMIVLELSRLTPFLGMG